MTMYAFKTSGWSLIIATVALCQPGGAAEGPIWPTYRGNPQRTGQSPFAGPAPMRVKWEVDLKHEICASPAVAADGTIFVGAGAVLYAISPDGRELWSHDFVASGHSFRGASQAFTSPSPALAPDGTLYQVCARGPFPEQSYVFAIDSRPKPEQRVKWSFKTASELRSSPLVAHDTCFVGDRVERMVLAFDMAGRQRWPLGQPPQYSVTSSPALSRDGRTLYVGGLDGRLHALDIETGQLKWSAGPKNKGEMRFLKAGPEGKQYYRFTTFGHVPEAPAVGPDGTIYFGSWDGHLYAAAPGGALRWSLDLMDRVTSAPAVSADGRVLISTFEGTLYAVRIAHGKPVIDWQLDANCRYSSPLISSDGKVYIGTLDGKLLALDLDSGKPLGQLAFGGWIYASAVPGGDGVFYVGAGDGILRAIEAVGTPAARPGGVAAAARDRPQERGATSKRTLSKTRKGATSRKTATVKSARLKPGRRSAGASTHDEVIGLARAYMNEEDPAKRDEILRKVQGQSERLDEIALALRPVPPAGAPTGEILEDRFTLPRGRARMAPLTPKPEGPVVAFVPEKGGSPKVEEHLNWVYVPEQYDPGKPLGMAINIHGGSGRGEQSAARDLLKSDPLIQDLKRTGEFLIVCPSTPPMMPRKWSYPESETHIQSIIEEYCNRYAIDPNRIYLMGRSMGGIGSWWQALRQSDRFALIAPLVGHWGDGAAFWPRLRGTLIYVMDGAFDYTVHVNFVRYAHQRLKALDIPHIDAEFLGCHLEGTVCRPHEEALLELIKTTRRDPYCPHVCAISPFVPSGEARRYPPSPYSFWAEVVQSGGEGVVVESSRYSKNGMSMGAEPRLVKAGTLDAENLGGNRFRVKATNVNRFALWLHPKMGIDFAKPAEIELIEMRVDPATMNEIERRRRNVTVTARPSLAAMLKYLGDRRDYGLIYHAMAEVACDQ